MPPTTRQSRKRQQTGNHIAAVAFDLFETQGYDAVTMEQIATAADVARGTLYNHFAVKEAVLAHSIHAQLQRDLEPLMMQAMRQAAFNDRVTTLLEASAAWWMSHRRYLAPYVRYRFQGIGTEQESRSGTATSDIVLAYVQVIEAAQSDGELRTDAPAERIAMYLHFLCLSALMRWLDDGRLSLADEFNEALDFFNRGAAMVV